MAFQKGTSAASGSYRGLLTRLVAFATSKHVSAVAVNAGGTGYTVGDILTVTHAGAYAPLLLEVLTLSGSAVATVAIRSAGAFSSRVASATVNAGGTGYTTGHIVRLTTGTFTEFGKFTVTASAGVATAVAVFETGGAYSADPTLTASPTTSNIGLGSGTGLTVNVTMTGLIGTSGITCTGGTGSGATFDLTLTDTGWSALWNRNNYSFNSITDEKEVILQGTVAGGDAPLVGIRSYTATSGDTRYGWLIAGMDSYNSGLTFATQPNVGPDVVPSTNNGICLLMFDNAQSYWFRVTPRKLVAVIKAVGASVTSYTSMYAGLLNPFGTQVESPYPMYLSGSTRAYSRKPDVGGFFVTGLTELFSDTIGLCPAVFRHPSTGAWTTVQNSNNGSAITTIVLYPIGAQALANSNPANEDDIGQYGQFNFQMGGAGVSLASGSAPTQIVMPTLGSNELLLIPPTILPGSSGDNTSEIVPRGELDGVYWIPGNKSDASVVASEDTITIGSLRYTIFANAHRTERYSFFAVAEN